jgi:hypothetical protein
MADIVNLRRARKQASRQRDDETAAAQRAAHGVTKAERQANKARRNKAERDLERHRLPDKAGK